LYQKLLNNVIRIANRKGGANLKETVEFDAAYREYEAKVPLSSMVLKSCDFRYL